MDELLLLEMLDVQQRRLGILQRLRQPGAMLYTSAPILDQQAIAGTDSTGEPSVSGTVSFCFTLDGMLRAVLLDQLRHQRRPSRLMPGAQPRSRLPVKIFVEKH